MRVSTSQGAGFAGGLPWFVACCTRWATDSVCIAKTCPVRRTSCLLVTGRSFWFTAVSGMGTSNANVQSARPQMPKRGRPRSTATGFVTRRTLQHFENLDGTYWSSGMSDTKPSVARQALERVPARSQGLTAITPQVSRMQKALPASSMSIAA